MNKMKTLHLNLITASALSLDKVGAYRYAQAARILLCGFAFDSEPVAVFDVTDGSPMPQRLREALLDTSITKIAHDANFARTLIHACWNIQCPPEQWRCTYVMAQALVIPSKLDECRAFLGLSPQPETRDRQLISRFCMPQNPTATQHKIWVGRDDFPAEWNALKSYCNNTVSCERVLFQKLQRYDLLPEEWRLWSLDQRMNDAGVAVDMALVESAVKIDDMRSKELLAEAMCHGLKNPNSVAQLQRWLLAEHDEAIGALNKSTMPALLQKHHGSAKRVLEIRQQLSKTSVQKYQAIRRCVCKDGRIRGLLQFLGAARTGRWAGRLVQIQNLPKNSLTSMDLARNLVRDGDVETLELLFGNAQSVLSELIRTAFIAPAGKQLLVCDFSSIEARVLAWGAGETWRLNVFRGHGKIYEASASEMFKVPVERIAEGNPEYALRQKGKVAELALGYNGGPQALIDMGALDMGLIEEELPGLVSTWRASNPSITAFWRHLEREAKTTLETQASCGRFNCEDEFLFMSLPSGRRLAYPKARLVEGRYGSSIQYWGKDSKSHKWQWIDTYGGKLVENWCQAVARDVLREALFAVDAARIGNLLFTVHDEIVLEGKGQAIAVEKIMAREIAWAKGLPLAAKGFTSTYYRKE
jgi:DNA polymerase